MNTKSRLTSFLAASAVALCLTVLPLSADTFGLFSYTDYGTSIEITAYPESAIGEVVIPSKINDRPVTSIGSLAFYGCSGLTNVTIPYSVTNIGRGAFKYCSGLTSMTIPSSITTIKYETFGYCTSLSSVTIPASVTSIEWGAFEGCSSLKSVGIPPSVTTIADGLFTYCSSLLRVTIPPGVTSIGNASFAGCSSLTSITIPSSITSIGYLAFQNCSSLTNMTIPSSVSTIDERTFEGCSGLIKVTIPSSVTSIADMAFKYCTGLTNVTIPSSVTLIEYAAFGDCSSLSKATFLGSAPVMGTNVFDDCSANFKVYYFEGQTGFTSPTWLGYPTGFVNAEITVQQPVGTYLVDGATKKSFGTMVVGKTGNAKNFTLKNTGSKNLTGLAITKNGAHATNFIITAPAKTWLAPGTSTTFNVRFKPTAAGTRNAAIHIKSNDSNENPFDIKLTGLGVAP